MTQTLEVLARPYLWWWMSIWHFEPPIDLKENTKCNSVQLSGNFLEEEIPDR